MNDTDRMTAFLAFGLLFGGLALYLARLGLACRRLEARLARIESATGKRLKDDGDGGTRQ